MQYEVPTIDERAKGEQRKGLNVPFEISIVVTSIRMDRYAGCYSVNDIREAILSRDVDDSRPFSICLVHTEWLCSVNLIYC